MPGPASASTGPAPAIVIARRAAPGPAVLADPGVALKSVLRSPVAG